MALLFIVAAVQYFLVQFLVAAQFKPHYSLAQNVISDLGNTVTSPAHLLMNISFIALGLAMIVGSVALVRTFKHAKLGFSLFAVGGLGTVLVGVFPENTIGTMHAVGAFLPFLVGNIGLIILGYSLKTPRPLKIYTVASGVLALIALGLFVAEQYLGIGRGGMERLVAYPQTIWMIVLGHYILTTQKRKNDRYRKP